MFLKPKQDIVNNPSQEEIKKIMEESKPKKQAALFLRHIALRKYLRDEMEAPLLTDKQREKLNSILSEPDNYNQYLGLYKKSRVFERCFYLLEKKQVEAREALTEMFWMFATLDTMETAEEAANIILHHIDQAERKEIIDVLNQVTRFYASTIKTDEEGYMEIDAAHHWMNDEMSVYEQKRNVYYQSLIEAIKQKSKYAQKKITEFYSVAEGLKQMINKVNFPLYDIYLRKITKMTESIKDKQPRGFKYNYDYKKANVTAETGLNPYMAERRDTLMRRLNYYNFTYEADQEAQQEWYELFLEDWEDLTGRKF